MTAKQIEEAVLAYVEEHQNCTIVEMSHVIPVDHAIISEIVLNLTRVKLLKRKQVGESICYALYTEQEE